MKYFTIPATQLPWLSQDLADALRQFSSYRDPFTNVIEYEIADGQYNIMLTRFPETAGHRRRWPRPGPVTRQAQINITTGQITMV
jgi:hypothetical protein